MIKRKHLGGKKPGPRCMCLYECKICGKEILEYPCRVKNPEIICCSFSCANKMKWVAKQCHPTPGRKGIENPNWKGGIGPYKDSYKQKKNRKKLIKDNPSCCVCGKPSQLAHHIDLKKDNQELGNLAPMCYVCHNLYHFLRRAKCPISQLTGENSFLNWSPN